jgi:hypothetical protein
MALSSAATGNLSRASSATTTAAAWTAPSRRVEARWLLRALLVGGAALAVATAAMTGDPTAYLSADPALGTLLRGMAVIKALLAAAAVAALLWRFARPIGRPVAALYLAGTWCMAAASMLVWRLSHIGIGALVFHAGELTLLFVAWHEHRRETLVGQTR